MLFPKRKRRRWWEFDETTKQYVEGMHQKFRSLPANLQPQILRLPRSFTCFHFNKKVPIEDRLRFTLTEVAGRQKGALEYVMLEIDRVILRKAKAKWKSII